ALGTDACSPAAAVVLRSAVRAAAARWPADATGSRRGRSAATRGSEAQPETDSCREVVRRAVPAGRRLAAVTDHRVAEVQASDRPSRWIQLEAAGEVEGELGAILRPREQHQRALRSAALDAPVRQS